MLALADKLGAPMVLSLKAKEGLEDDNPFEVGQSGLIGNPATELAFDGCDALFWSAPTSPTRTFLPEGKTVIQLDVRGTHVGRRHAGGPRAGRRRPRSACSALLPAAGSRRRPRPPRRAHGSPTSDWRSGQQHFADPAYDHKPVGLLRRKVDNPDGRDPPRAAGRRGRPARRADAVFTTDTGMSTVWLSRFVRMTGTRRLIGSYNLGSMANAMPQALGAAALDRDRQVVAFCGDGGLTMLLGDLLTAVSHDLPVKLVVFDNSRLGMVKLEMEQVGLPEFGTVLHNPRLREAWPRRWACTGCGSSDPGDVDEAVREAMASPGPVLLDVLTNPDEIAIPPKPTVAQGWGFAIAKSKEFVTSAE